MLLLFFERKKTYRTEIETRKRSQNTRKVFETILCRFVEFRMKGSKQQIMLKKRTQKVNSTIFSWLSRHISVFCHCCYFVGIVVVSHSFSDFHSQPLEIFSDCSTTNHKKIETIIKI